MLRNSNIIQVAQLTPCGDQIISLSLAVRVVNSIAARGFLHSGRVLNWQMPIYPLRRLKDDVYCTQIRVAN
jgi:hypothetical protein